MASAATAPLPIYYNTDVHNFYIKQKQEFHFTQKSDNEFLMFLLDTAVRVISIVQHLAPVIEAVSDAGVEVDDIEDEVSPVHTPNTTSNISSGAMDVDTDAAPSSALSAELEQINQEITNAQISSQQLPRQPSIPRRVVAAPAPAHIPVSVPAEPEPVLISASQPSAMMTVSQPTALLPVAQPAPHMSVSQPTAPAPSTSVPRTDPAPVALPPNVPLVQLPSSAHSSENTSTSLPSATQPVAEPPDDAHSVKTEQPVPEVIEIKEEVAEPAASASSELLSQDTLDQLMSSISGAEDSAGLQNFVPTATPSSLPPSFLDRGAGNPLSMLGSLNSGDGPGPSGLNVPNISESMMKNINDAGLNVSSIKGQANPNIRQRKKPGTHRAEMWAVTAYRKWAESQHNLDSSSDIPTKFKDLPLDRMNTVLSRFVVEVKNQDEEEYSARTLNQLIRGLLRVSKEIHGAQGAFDNKLNSQFYPLQLLIRKKTKNRGVRLTGTAHRRNTSCFIITHQREDILWRKALKFDNPQSLICALVFIVLKSFGLNGPNELTEMDMDMITITELGNDEVLYTYKEGGENFAAGRTTHPPHTYHHICNKSDSRDLHFVLEKYLAKCSPKVRQGSCRLFQHPLVNIGKKEWPWFGPVGKNLGRPIGRNFFPKMMQQAYVKCKFRSHFKMSSVRQTVVGRLRMAGYTKEEIMIKTGRLQSSEPIDIDLIRRLSQSIRGQALFLRSPQEGAENSIKAEIVSETDNPVTPISPQEDAENFVKAEIISETDSDSEEEYEVSIE